MALTPQHPFHRIHGLPVRSVGRKYVNSRCAVRVQDTDIPVGGRGKGLSYTVNSRRTVTKLMGARVGAYWAYAYAPD